MFENKVLRKIFGAKRDEITGECRKLHSVELHALYSPDIIKTTEVGGICSTFRRIQKCILNFSGKTRVKEILEMGG